MKYWWTSIILFSNISILFSQAGQLDSSFNATGKVVTSISDRSLEGNSVLIQPDGKILVAGISTSDSTLRDFVIIRYNTDGTIDETFNHSGWRIIDFYGANDFCYDMALDSVGRILLTGTTFTPSSGTKTALVRLNTDGSFDNTFGSNGITVSDLANSSESAQAVLLQDDGEIIVTGSVTTFSPFQTRASLLKFHSDGTLDKDFGTLGSATAVVPMGYNANFGILQPDGKIIAGGFILESAIDIIMLRFLPDGSLDNSFGINGIVRTDFNGEEEFARAIAIQADQKILVAYGRIGSNGSDFGMARYHEDGSLDNSFGNNGKVVTDFPPSSNTSHDIAIQEDQKILLAGFVGSSPGHNFALARYNPDGSLDAGFGNNGRVVTNLGHDDLAFAMTIQPDKKIVLAGHSIQNDTSDFALARYLSGVETVAVKNPVNLFINHSFFPNPTSNQSILKYTLTQDRSVNISLYDQTGQKIQNFLSNQWRRSGNHEELLKIDPHLPPGNYILVIESQDSKTSFNAIID